MQVVTNNFGADGVYYSQAPNSATPIPADSESLTIFDGTASWGVPGVLTPFSDIFSMTDAFGPTTAAPNSLTDEAVNFLEFSNAAAGIRVVDGTDVAATMAVLDNAGTPGTLGTLTAICTGSRPNGNAQTPASSYTLSQSASYTTARPVYRFSPAMSGATPEVFDGILGYTVSGNTVTISNAAFNASLAQAINVGANSRSKSQYWVYVPNGSASNSTAPALTTGGLTTLGTDGSSGVTASLLMGAGTDGTANPQGIYAARNSGAGQIVVCGLTDFTQAPALQTFAQQEFMLAVGPVAPSGTTVSAAVTLKQTNNANSTNIAPCKDWITIQDQRLQYARPVSPLGEIAGIISALPPQASPGNKPQGGANNFLSTEQLGKPYSLADRGKLISSGFLFLVPSRTGGGYVLAGGQNASGIPGQDGINFTRMSNFIAKSAPLILAPFVDALIGTSALDPTITSARNAMQTWLNSLVKSGAIDTFELTLDQTNNTQQTIQQSILNCSLVVSTKGVARFINILAQVGVAIISSPALLAAA